MSLSRVTTWSSGQVLTASALNAEFDNILNNALSLISPLTGNLDFSGFRADNVSKGSLTTPGLNFTGDTNTGVTSSAADVMELAAGGNEVLQLTGGTSDITYVDVDSGATTVPPIIRGEGETNTGLDIAATGAANIRLQANSVTMLTVTSSTSVDMGTNKPFIPAAVSGSPTANGLFRDNTPKAWALVTVSGGTPTLVTSFNVTSVTDNAVGDTTLNLTTAMADGNYCPVAVIGDFGSGNALRGAMVSSAAAPTTTAFRYVTGSSGGLEDVPRSCVAIFGTQ